MGADVADGQVGRVPQMAQLLDAVRRDVRLRGVAPGGRKCPVGDVGVAVGAVQGSGPQGVKPCKVSLDIIGSIAYNDNTR